MGQKQPLSFEEFERCLNIVKKDYDYFDACGVLGLELVDRVSSPNKIIQIITDLFEDEDDWLSWYIFEKDWGTNQSLQAYNPDNTIIPTNTLADIYQILCENYHHG